MTNQMDEIEQDVESLFSGITINQAHLMAAIGVIVTAVVAFVPSWAPEKEAIIAALGGVVSAAFPLVTAVKKAIEVLEGVIKTHKVTLHELESNAISAAKTEIGKIDFDKLVQDAESAHGLSVSQVESLAESKAREIILSLLGQQAASATPVAQVDQPTVQMPAVTAEQVANVTPGA